jgi:hypothetical protein
MYFSSFQKFSGMKYFFVNKKNRALTYFWYALTRLRHCAKSRKVAGWIPNDITGNFHLYDSYGLGLTQPPTEKSTRNISWGKGGRYVGLTNLPLLCADYLAVWEPQPPGTLTACPVFPSLITVFNINCVFL